MSSNRLSQVEECEENFVKTCYIEYEQKAVEERIKVAKITY